MERAGRELFRRGSWRRITTAAVMVCGVGGAAVAGGVVAVPAANAVSPCSNAGTTGLTAKVIATANSTYSSTVDATGCDIGIYIGPGIDGVTISGSTVSGANDQGILAEDSGSVTIDHETVSGNGVNPTKGIDSDKAVMLVGVSGSQVTDNTVTGNFQGGISVADESNKLDPAAPSPTTSLPGPVKSTGNVISGNQLSDNYGGCGIIVESWVPGAGVTGTQVTNNTITGAPGQFGPHGPVIGQIVVATDAAFATVSGTTVSGNTVTDSFVSGITVHSNAPGDSITTTSITGNTLSGNNWGDANGAPETDAIALIVNNIPPPAPALTLSGTTITGNHMSEATGVWQTWQVTGTTLSGNVFTGKRELYTQPAPGKGYWMAGSDGGVFSFGAAAFYGSAGDVHLAAPVVGILQTRDQGGYVLVAKDGGAFTYGDATFYGSVPGTGHPATAPVVGGALAPVVNGPEGTPGTNGLGYWMAGSDGNVYAFGQDAKSFGNLVGTKLAQPVVAIAPTADGLGYWMVAADGGVFSFGDAHFYGSLGGIHLAAPIVGIAPTPSGHGYWLVGKDGGVFTFGDAAFYGSQGGQTLSAPIHAIIASPDGHGYILVGADGAVYPHGDATSSGSLSGITLAAPVQGATMEGVLP